MKKDGRWNVQFVAKLFAVNVLFTGYLKFELSTLLVDNITF